jgi:hypothetical protein
MSKDGVYTYRRPWKILGNASWVTKKTSEELINKVDKGGKLKEGSGLQDAYNNLD